MLELAKEAYILYGVQATVQGAIGVFRVSFGAHDACMEAEKPRQLADLLWPQGRRRRGG